MRSLLFFLARSRGRLQRELKSLHLTQWAGVGRKNNWRAETLPWNWSLFSQQHRLEDFCCIMSPGGPVSSHISTIHFSCLYFSTVLSYGGEMYSRWDPVAMKSSHHMSLPTHVVKKVCFLPSQLIVQMCVLWFCLGRLQRKLSGWTQKLPKTPWKQDILWGR